MEVTCLIHDDIVILLLGKSIHSWLQRDIAVLSHSDGIASSDTSRYNILRREIP